ncbi:uncharacterized protein N7498_000119 [Penicillium cinerascens]|uniref:Serine/threonine-protein kinase ATG1 n=1 Tax=Penicillium cinerascens TaxID=70096 RepID=A0A9W9NDT1_9EURO|nr:uncharacterized protein N7498_000119 [Penicillium cinerascens]KAJ5218020.1 hypothetical protein N7498_000119 [Penicillium cinerascens]
MDPNLSDLVLDTRIQVEFGDNVTYRHTVQSKVSTARHVRRRHRKDTWKVERILGSGSYGIVTLHKCLTSEGPTELQAVKMIEKAVVSKGIDYYEELEAVAKFSQKKYEGLFVEFIGWYENDISVFIVMEYMEHGDLDSHLQKPLPKNEAREITLQIAEGLELLHESGFAHRDLKPANIFVFRKSPDWWVKIGDFGISKRFNDSDGLQTWVGTPGFLAPEVRFLDPYYKEDDGIESSYTEKVDIWALGVITFYMIFYKFPFGTKQSTSLKQYLQGAPLSLPLLPVSEECSDFIKAAMAPKPSKRLSAKEATQHDWLRRTDVPLGEMKNLKITEASLPGVASKQDLREALKPAPKEVSNKLSRERIEEANVSAESSDWFTADNGFEAEEQSNPQARQQLSFQSSVSFGLLGISKKFLVSPHNQGLQFFRGDKLVEAELLALHNEGVQFFRQNKWKEAEAMLQTAVEKRNQLLGMVHKDTRNSYHCLGVLYYHMAKYSQAKDLFNLVLEAQLKIYGPKNASTLKSHYWVGVLEMREGSYGKGQTILRDVASMQKKVLGSNHPDTLLSISESQWQPPQPPISTQLLEMNKATIAIKKSIQNLLTGLLKHPPRSGPRKRIRIRVRLPQSSPRITTNDEPKLSASFIVETHCRTIAELGQILHGQEDYVGAREHLERQEVADGRRASFGLSNKSTLQSLNALGKALIQQKKWVDSEAVLCDAAGGWEQMDSVHYEDSGQSFMLLGVALYRQGKIQEAEDFLWAASQQISNVGARNSAMYPAAIWLGLALLDLQMHSKSEKAFRWAVAASRNDENLSESSLWLARAMCKQDKHEQAKQLCRFVFEERSIRLGKDARDTLESSYWLGYACHHTNEYSEAEARLFQALVVWRKSFGLSDSTTQWSLHWYGKTLQAQQKYKLAEKAFKELVGARTLALGHNHEKTLSSMVSLASSLESQGKLAEAHVLFKEAWGEWVNKRGADDRLTIETARCMERTRLEYFKGLSRSVV